MNLKEKIHRLKTILATYETLKKTEETKKTLATKLMGVSNTGGVSVKKTVDMELMGVGDHKAPGVQGGEIAPKQVKIPEPVEYPDIEEKIVNVHKHAFEGVAEAIQKGNWMPSSMKKNQVNPSTTVPYVQSPEKGGPANPHNVDAHMQSLRDRDMSVGPGPADPGAYGAAMAKQMGSVPNTVTSTPDPLTMGKHEHTLEVFANQFRKTDWNPKKP